MAFMSSAILSKELMITPKESICRDEFILRMLSIYESISVKVGMGMGIKMGMIIMQVHTW